MVRLFAFIVYKGVLLGLLCPPAMGQDVLEEVADRAPGIIEEIMVTAQKREQSLQDVGIAITAFTGAQIDQLGLDDSIELIRFTPGVAMAGDLGGQRALFAIRGVVQSDFADHAEAPVAVYIDEGYLASTQAQTFGLFDIERVEILKGPQGTLFGRNATGGLVHTVTRKPTEQAEGYLEAGYGRFAHFRLEAAYGGPLTDSLRARVAVLRNRQGEILKNIYDPDQVPPNQRGTPGGGQDGYNDDTLATRVHVEWDMLENLRLLVTANHVRTIRSEGPYQGVGTVPVLDPDGRHIDTLYARDVAAGCEALSSVDGSCINLFADGDTDGVRPVPGGDLFGYVDPDGSGRLTSKDFAFEDENRFQTWALAGKLTWDLGTSSLVALSDYKKVTRSVSLDSDQSPTPLALFQSEGEIEQFSQEVRLSGSKQGAGSGAGLDWVAGAYYLMIDTDVTQGLAYPRNSPFLAGFPQIALQMPGVVFGPTDDNTTGLLRTDSYALYGQLEYDLSERLSFIGGARMTREEKGYRQTIGQFVNRDDRLVDSAESTGFIPRAPFAGETGDTLWSGKAQLDFHMTDTTLLYAGVNRGVKAGSFNAKLFDGVALTDAEIPYDPEVLTSYEAGFKSVFAGSDNGARLSLNAAAFYYDYDSFQSFTWQRNSGFVTNYDATFKGVELELSAVPADGLYAAAGLSYTDATVFDVAIAPGILRDVAPPFTPEWQGHGLLRYSWPGKVWPTVSSGTSGRFTLQASMNYQSGFYHNVRNFSAHRFEGYTVVDMQISWESDDGFWRFAAWADNLTDSDHRIIGFDISSFGGYSQESFARPRSFGLTVRRTF